MNPFNSEYVDPIHGAIANDWPTVIFDIVATPHVQRQAKVKQLGAACFTFPKADHTRLQHALGVCYLTKTLLDVLAAPHNDTNPVNISPLHYQCAMIAGLLHDIGHGPFSHMWERFVHKMAGNKSWTHEDTSVRLIEDLFEKNPSIKLDDDPLKHAEGVKLIAAMVSGNDELLLKLLGKENFFLGELVNNKACGIDVDKWDYMLRDKFHLRSSLTKDFIIDFNNLFINATVMKHSDGRNHITFRDKDIHLIKKLYETRFNLYVACYNEINVIITERMLLDAFVAAEENGFTFKGSKLSEAHLILSTYLELNDTIANTILNVDKDLGKAKDILKSIFSFQFYQRLEAGPVNGTTTNVDKLQRYIRSVKGMMKGNVFYLSQNGKSQEKTTEELDELLQISDKTIQEDFFVLTKHL